MLPELYVLKDTVQSFPAGSAVAPIWTIGERGPILPPFGTKQRDYMLRNLSRQDFNGIWPGAVSGIKKKIASTPWTIDGDSPYTQYYQDILQNAHFSQGWTVFLKRIIADILEQDYGGFIEIIADGPADTPIEGPVRGIAHLDAGRCYVTGNPTWPVLYYSLWSGSLHKLHASRVYRIVDNPSPDERFYGIGTCALSRGIAAVQREIRMGQYVDLTLDDRPPPGLMMVNNIADKQWEAAMQKYGTQLMADQIDHFGRTMILKNLDPEKEASVTTVSFATPPDKFDFVAYSEFDIDVIANALGIDRQEIAELKGRSIGSGAQSQVLAEKARGKTAADIYSAIERLLNLVILPPELNMTFKADDPKVDEQKAALNNSYATTAVALVQAGIFSAQQAAKLLATQSDDFADVLINEQGQLATSQSETIQPEVPQVEAPKQPAQIPASTSPAQTSTTQQVSDNETISKSLVEKEFNSNQPRDERGRWGTLGGSYRRIRPNSGEEIHHMPSAESSPLHPSNGPVIRMSREDHLQTASYGTSREAREYRRKQRELISAGNFHQAQQMDIEDIHTKFGDKYEGHIKQAQEYTKQLTFSKQGNIPRNPTPKQVRRFA